MSFGLNAQAITFLQRETRALDRRLLVMTAVSGIANALILAAVNACVEAIGHGGPTWRNLFLFMLSTGMFVYTLRYTMAESSRISEDAVRSIRIRLADKIRRLDLLALEAIGEEEIHARISRETASFSEALRPLFTAGQEVILGAFTLVYMAWISPVAAILCLLILVVGIGVHLNNRRVFQKGLQEASGHEDALAASLNGMMKGFKELRLNPLKSDDALGEFGEAATRARDTRVDVLLQHADMTFFLELFFMSMIGALIFALPVVSAQPSIHVAKLVTSVLFLTGPLYGVFKLVPTLSLVNVTVGNLERLEARLDEGLAQSSPDGGGATAHALDFGTIAFQDLSFLYPGQEPGAGFQVGPINLEWHRGELLFLLGGNGSGKTTLLKLLTALYPATSGCIRVDGVTLGPAAVQEYRGLFSAVFSDFHLFEKLHGLRGIRPEQVKALLRTMNIAHKTAFRDGRFTELHLSTGQRKRLALVVSLLEDKPIHIFDEVASDQDPTFRTFYYEVVLPGLKQAGKSVLVVTHDDGYVHLADRVFTMDYGLLEELPRGRKPAGKARRGRGRTLMAEVV